VDSAALAKEPFVSITTFKRDGTPVSVPVWCAADNGTLLVFSEADSWKLKRIGRDAHVRVAPCSARGTPRGPAVDRRRRVGCQKSVGAVTSSFRLTEGYDAPSLARLPWRRSVWSGHSST
jgi:PPOX class probable F420-dependent enzyme